MMHSRHYKAFISYSHSDEAWARWLQRALERYKLPKTFRQSHPELPVRLYPIFRDRDELASGGELSESIRKAMDDSDALIVICSPAARASLWVNEEVRRFRLSGRGHRIFCLLVTGSPDPHSADCAFPAAILQNDNGTALLEPLAADATPKGDGKRNAMLKIAAGLLGVGVDDLKRRDAQRQARFWSLVAFGALFIAVLTVGLAIYAFNAKKESEMRRQQAEGLIGFMLGDLRKKLEPIGKLDLLDAVGDQAMSYFATLGDRGTSKEMLARAVALKQIGDVRFNQGKLEPALKAFEQSLLQAEALYKTDPGNNDYLFELGQAEFWVGYVAWQRGQLDQAATSMQRYMQYSKQLSKRAPDNIDYQMELGYSHSNLGSIAYAQGKHEDALREFRTAVQIQSQVLQKKPSDTAIASNLADSASWIGTILQELGRLSESQSAFMEAMNIIKPYHLSGKDTEASRLYAIIVLYQSEVAIRRGDVASAKKLIDEAKGIFRELSLHDPSNSTWKNSLLSSDTYLLSLVARHDWTSTERDIQAHAGAEFSSLIKADPSNLPFQINFLEIRRLGILDLLTQGNVQAAQEAAQRAWSEWQEAIKGRTQTAEALYAETRFQETIGTVFAANGEHEKAAAHWQESAQKLEASVNPDPAFLAIRRLLALNLGQDALAESLRVRLAESEYRDPRMEPDYTLSAAFSKSE